jgi:predicted lipoprotein with Yx(FWY)xxD motif
MKRIAAIALCASALLAVGCGGDDDDMTAGTAAQPTPAAEAPDKAQKAEGTKGAEGATKAQSKPATGTEIVVADSEFGQMLFDTSEQAIYLFDKESGPTSECYEACADAWPPVLTDGRPQAGAGVDAALLGTTKRDDGSVQLTYGGHPLYYYAHEGPGQVLCHNVEEFGGLWLVVDPGGEAVS